MKRSTRLGIMCMMAMCMVPVALAQFTSDDFSAPTINTSLWTITNPAPASTIDLTGTGTTNALLRFQLPASSHNISGSGNFAPRLMQTSTNSNFTAVIKFQSLFTVNGQMQGIIVEQDANRYLRFDFYRTSGSLRAYSASYSSGSSTQRISTSITGTNPMWLRVARSGNTWTMSYSTNGTSFTTAGSFSYTLTVSKVGPFAGNTGSPAPATTVLVDYFFNNASPVSPEDPTAQPPSITTQPAAQTVNVGQTATFTVSASGTAPLAYQWQKNAVNISGATSTSYTTPATVIGDSGSTFRCIVSNSAGTVTSNSALLRVNRIPPAITTHPAAQAVNVGQTATFTVAASGTAPLAYQWQKNSVNVAGATSSSYTTPATVSGDNGSTFRCVVSNPAGTATSNQATLTVNATQSPYLGSPAAIPGTIQAENYDNGGEGIAYHDLDASNLGGAYRTNEGVDLEATTDTGGGNNVGWVRVGEWLEYTVNIATAGTYTINVRVASSGNGGTFHIEFAGVDKTGLMLVPNTGAWQTWQTVSKTGVSLNAGQQIMRIALDTDGATGFTGNINYVAISSEGSSSAPSITTQPAAQTVNEGQTATFTVAATGTAPLAYQWQKNAVNIAGASSSSYTTPVTVPADSGSTFRCIVSNSLGTVTSNSALLRVNSIPPSITTQPTAQTVNVGQTATFTVAATGTAPLAYQWQKNTVNVSGATSASYTTPATVIGDSGSTFRCIVSNSAGTTTSNSALLRVNSIPPSIATQPAAQTVNVGQTATFTVAATGTAPLAYQWQKNAVNVSGATSASYTTPATVIGDSGSTFRCIVSNSAGTATSNSALLRVNRIPPSITTHPVAQTVNVGQTATFTVVATGTAPLGYQWQKNTVNIAGATSSSYTTPATIAADSGSTFRCVVSNSAGTATSNGAILHVSPSSQTSTIVSDDFHTGTLNASVWTFVNPLTDATQSITGANTANALLNIVVPGGTRHDIYDQGYIAPRIMQNANNTDFTAEAKFQSSFTGQYQHQGIVAEQDANNVIRFDIYYDGENTNIFAASMIGGFGAPDMHINTNIGSGAQNPAYMRINRTGNVWTLSYSLNGTTFTQAGQFALPFTLTKIGVWGGNSGMNPAFTLLCDYFFNTASPIVPEDPTGPPQTPSITQQPDAQTVSEGQPTTFTVAATGTAPLTYQWQKNAVNIGGASGSSYTTPATVLSDNGATFRCIVSNAVGTITSNTALLTVQGSVSTVGGPWWNTQWRYRTQIAVNGGGFQRTSKVANFTLNFTTILTSLGAGGSFNPQSVRVIEVNGSGTVVDQNVVFQFDQDPAFNASTNALGTVAFQISGTTAANTTRYYHIYFDTNSGFTLPTFSNLLTITDNVSYQGQLSYQVNNQLGSLIYHKQGAGFASMKDLNNVEWIGYNNTAGSHAAGEYRGIPNLGVAGHPGYTNATSTIVSQGPIKITIKSQTNDGSNYTWFWDFYPTYATMTLTQAGSNYWLLYEGTPAGTVDQVNGYVKNSAGQNLNLGSSFAADLPNPEWAYFGQTGQPRFMFLAHHENDGVIDHYRPFVDVGTMTVFGFGRDGSSTNKYMNTVPQHLTFGFGESEPQAQTTMNNAYRDLTTSTGASEQNVSSPPSITQQPANQTVTVGQTATFSVTAVGGIPLAYQWQKNNVNISGATASSHTTPATVLADNGATFRCIVSNSLGTVTSNTALLTVNSVPQSAVSDDFSAGTINTNLWTFINPLSDGSATLTGTGTANAMLNLAVPAGTAHDVWAGNMAPRLMQTIPNGDFEVEVKFQSPLTAQYQLEGIIVQQNATNFMRFDFYYDGSGPRLFAATFTNNSPSVQFDQPITPATILYMRIRRQGNQWTQSYSYNGTNWTTAASFSHTLTVSSVGPFAGNAGPNPAFTALVDYFFNTASPVVPEDPTGPPQAPSITTQPAAQIVTEGQTATFTVEATGTAPLAYQWQKNAVNVSGATSASYTTPATVSADSGSTFRCIVSNSVGTVTSSSALLRVNRTPPSITQQPANQTVTVGQTATFSVTAVGGIPLAYQWQKNNVNISGATASSHTTPATVLADNGATFRCIVSNSLGTVTSNTALLTVNSVPQSAVSDDFSAGTINTNLWTFINPLSDGSATLTGTGTANAMLNLAVPAGTAHDVWAGNMAPRLMQTIPNGDFEVEVKFQSPLTAQYQLEGIIVQQNATNFMRFDFYYDGSGPRLFAATFTNNSPSVQFDQPITPATILYMRIRRQGNQWTQSYSYNGTNWTTAASFSHTLTVSSVGPFAGNAGPNPAFTALVDYFFNTASPVVPEDPTGPPQAPSITTQPAAQIVTEGQTATFTVEATGTAPLAYQWQKNAVNVSGATSASYTTPATVSADSGSTFRCIVSNSVGTVTSSSALLRVNRTPPSITQQPANQTVTVGQTATFSVTAVGGIPLAYQWQKNNVNISGATASSHTTPATVLADNGATFRCIVSNSLGTVTSNTALLTVNSVPQSAVSDDFSAGTINTNLWTFINPLSDGSATLTGTGTANAMLNLAVPAGTAHDVWAGNMAPRLMQTIPNGDFEVEVKFQSPLTAQYQLEGIIVQQNATNFMRFDFYYDGSGPRLFAATFTNNSPSVQFDQPITPATILYMRIRRQGNQWTQSYSYNGTNWTTAASFSHTLTVSSVGPFAGNAGPNPAFTALVDYFFNTASPIVPEDPTGPPQAPSITTQPAAQIVTQGQTATFTVAASGTAPLAYQWQKNAVTISGATSASYTTPATVQVDSGSTFRCIVSNSVGTVTSNSALLRVTPAGPGPAITQHPANATVNEGGRATFTVAASGSPLTYQWQRSAVNIPGATSASFTTPALLITDNGATYRCIVTGTTGTSTSNSAVATVNSLTAPGINVWYGTTQSFGSIGDPIPYINILGHVNDPDGIQSLSYTKNGGAPVNLQYVSDGRRIDQHGDFNVEIARSTLNTGANTIVITLTDNLSNVTTKTVTVNYTGGGNTWSQTYSINWSSVTNIHSVAQPADGLWAVDTNGVRMIRAGYDRLLDIGEQSWTNYEVTFPFTVHSFTGDGFGFPSNGPGIGAVMRWNGNTDNPLPGANPKTGYLPLGAIGWFHWSAPGSGNMQMLDNTANVAAQDNSGFMPALGVRHMFKMKVHSAGAGQAPTYRMKMWVASQAEPSSWSLSFTGSPSDPSSGSLALIAQECDVNIGNVTIVPAVSPARPVSGEEDLIAMYKFTEGSGNIVHDVSAKGVALDLSIANMEATRWNPTGGLEIFAPATISSISTANKISEAMKATNEITVEAWLKPTAETYAKDKPAHFIRIEDSNNNIGMRHGFTEDRSAVKVETLVPVVSGKGYAGGLSSLSDKGELTHIVLTTEASGSTKLYVNGELQTTLTTGSGFTQWSDPMLILAGEKEWLGEYKLVAIYSRALNAEEIRQTFEANIENVVAAEAVSMAPSMSGTPTLITQEIPKEFALYQNFPNPFNPSTTIKFDLPKEEHVSLTMFNLLGQQVATLVNERRTAGSYNVQWNAQGFASGMYLYRIKAGDFAATRKVVLLK